MPKTLVIMLLLLQGCESCKTSGYHRRPDSECEEHAFGMANHECIRWKDAGPKAEPK